MYDKMKQLKPEAFEYVNGLIDGFSVALGITVNKPAQKGA